MKNKLTHDGTVYGFKIKEAFMPKVSFESFPNYKNGNINVYLNGVLVEKTPAEVEQMIADLQFSLQEVDIERERLGGKCAH